MLDCSFRHLMTRSAAVEVSDQLDATEGSKLQLGLGSGYMLQMYKCLFANKILLLVLWVR